MIAESLLWLLIVMSVLLLGVAVTTNALQLYSWWQPEHNDSDRYGRPDQPQLSALILLAARREPAVIGATLQQLTNQNYPRYRVAVIIDHRDDPETLAIARHYESSYPSLFLVVDYPVDAPTHNKPYALNEGYRVALAEARDQGRRYDYVGVLDAEDLMHEDLLTMVDYRFRHTGAGVVQAGVQLMNFSVRHSTKVPRPRLDRVAKHAGPSVTGQVGRALAHRWREGRDLLRHNMSGWWRAANCLEYYKWFRSRLKAQARIGVVPLGGNTVFFRTEFIDHVGGWSVDRLTEDAKIGIEASIEGVRVDVIYVPAMVTREETPPSLKGFIRQRMRWMQGFIEVFREYRWTQLPGVGRKFMAFFILGFPFYQAFTGVVSPVVLMTALIFKAPVPVALFSMLPLGLSITSMAVDVVMLAGFGREYHQAPVRRDYLGLVIGNYCFQVVLAIAAIGSIVRHIAGWTSWGQTVHVGAHATAILETAEEIA